MDVEERDVVVVTHNADMKGCFLEVCILVGTWFKKVQLVIGTGFQIEVLWSHNSEGYESALIANGKILGRGARVPYARTLMCFLQFEILWWKVPEDLHPIVISCPY